MFGFKSQKVDRIRTAQARQILDLQTELEALQRVLAIRDAELESLAGVIARDRERVKAETAAYVRQRAELEGNHAKLS